MTSPCGSPAPKSRGRNGRHARSGSAPSLPPAGLKHLLQQNHPNNNHHQTNHHHQLSSHTLSHTLTQPPPRSASGPTTPPQTPKAQSIEGGGKKKRKQRAKPKDVPTKDHTYSPLSDGSSSDRMSQPKASSPSSKAYAGPTFHHSPAPSALPMPKFLSKSVPATPDGGTSLQSMMENDDSSDNTTTPPSSLKPIESHLQKLFRADKEEKARLRGNGQGSDAASSQQTTPESSPAAEMFGLEPESPTYNRHSQRLSRTAPSEKPLNECFFSMEIDKQTKHVPQSPQGKSSDKPQLRSKTAPSNLPTQARLEEVERKAQSNALRKFLLSSPPLTNKVPTEPPSPAQRTYDRSFQAGPPLSRPRNAPGNGYLFMSVKNTTGGQSPVTPSREDHRQNFLNRNGAFFQTPIQQPQFRSSPTQNRHNHTIFSSKLEATKAVSAIDVMGMENSLRKVLKMDSFY